MWRDCAEKPDCANVSIVRTWGAACCPLQGREKTVTACRAVQTQSAALADDERWMQSGDGSVCVESFFADAGDGGYRVGDGEREEGRGFFVWVSVGDGGADEREGGADCGEIGRASCRER